jgi:hypothetical protein
VSQADPEDDGRSADASGRAATFDDIVAGWLAEGTVPRWPGDDHPGGSTPPPAEDHPRPADVERPAGSADRDVDPSAGTGPARPTEPPRPAEPPRHTEPPRPAESTRPAPPARARDTERAGQSTPPPAGNAVPPLDERFVPPDPPPLPRIGLTAAIGLALLGFGIVLLAVPELFGRGSALALPLGLLSLACGLAWLVLRSWQSDPPEDHDDGAVL